MDLKELRLLYPDSKAGNEPKADCKYCKGTGVNKDWFCICLYLRHDLLNENEMMFDAIMNVVGTNNYYEIKNLLDEVRKMRELYR
jgi:uncharacterized protein YmfQ (DUF2313 family)